MVGGIQQTRKNGMFLIVSDGGFSKAMKDFQKIRGPEKNICTIEERGGNTKKEIKRMLVS